MFLFSDVLDFIGEFRCQDQIKFSLEIPDIAS